LALICVCLAVYSLCIGFLNRKKQKLPWYPYLISSILWTGLAIFNLRAFNSILYVT
jgi:hypothetical protein